MRSQIDQKDAFSHACDMERPLDAIRNFVGALCMIAGKLEGGDVVYELAMTIQLRVDELNETHGYFFRLHHPDRERFEREGWPSEQAVVE